MVWPLAYLKAGLGFEFEVEVRGPRLVGFQTSALEVS